MRAAHDRDSEDDVRGAVPDLLDTTSDRAEVERLLEASVPRRKRRLPSREFAFELALSGVFLLMVLTLILSSSGSLAVEPIAIVMVGAYAIASRVDYPIATGVAVPTQLFLVALFSEADARLVPLLAMAGLMLGTTAMVGLGRSRWDRLVMAGGDAMHVLGPAVVLTVAGHTDATTAPWEILLLAFAGQCAVEFGSSSIRDWVILGLRPRVEALVALQVWAVDAALTPVAIMAVVTADAHGIPWAPLMLLPLLLLITHAARDRTVRVERLHRRLEALQRERRRLRAAVRRIGDAFASSLDLGALVSIVTRASVEALDAEAGRGSIVRDGTVLPYFDTNTVSRPELPELLDRVEQEAAASASMAYATGTTEWALAVPIGPAGDPVAIVSVARVGAAFADEERDLLAYLAAQAAVAAAHVAEHEELQRQALAAKAELEQRVVDRTADLAERTASLEALYAEVNEQAIQLRAASREQDALLRHLAHEVRGPLYAGDGLLELLVGDRPEDPEDQLRADLLSVRGTMHEALRVVDEQLENARLRSGSLRPPRVEPVDLNDLFAELRGTFRALHERESVELTVSVDADTPMLRTDRHFLGQAVRNLMTNAAKFTDTGWIKVRAHPVGEDRVQISVQDTGTGIEPDDRIRIFEEFAQVPEAQAARPAGTGIGLPLVRKLITTLGGTITLESEVGVGSTFTIELPVGPPSD